MPGTGLSSCHAKERPEAGTEGSSGCGSWQAESEGWLENARDSRSEPNSLGLDTPPVLSKQPQQRPRTGRGSVSFLQVLKSAEASGLSRFWVCLNPELLGLGVDAATTLGNGALEATRLLSLEGGSRGRYGVGRFLGKLF